MHCHYGLDGPVSLLIVLGGPSIGWYLVRTSSQWSELGLRRMRRLLIKKLPYHSLTTRGPSTRETLLSHTCAIFTLTTSMYWRWLVRKNNLSPSPSTWIRGLTSAWLRTGCICATMTSMRLLNWYYDAPNFGTRCQARVSFLFLFFNL